ncbi:MAG: hypothetical protein V7765_01870 [Oleispira sp.]
MKLSNLALTLISTLTTILLLSACSNSSQVDSDGFTTIEISDSDFSNDYPAVWFAPETMEIISIDGARRPPVGGGFQIWIEPKDPEFSVVRSRESAKGMRGFQLEEQAEGEGRLTTGIRGSHLYILPAYFTYHDGVNKYELVVLAFDKEEEEITFKWRAKTVLVKQ